MKKLLIVWGNWGPYHYARFRALHQEGADRGWHVEGLEMFPTSETYAWKTNDDHPAIHHLRMGNKEMDFRPGLLATRLLPLLRKIRPDVILVPSYWHWSLVLNYAGRLLGAKIVMMNESHAATAKATGVKHSLKSYIVRHFHAGFVGGTPHKRHFASLGLPENKIFLGYDAVDNGYFMKRAQEAREQAAMLREKLELPSHYFLNLGRMVAKKNLPCLIRAYALLRERRPDLPHDLVLVGSGEEEETLRTLCRELGLATADHSPARRQEQLAFAGSATGASTGITASGEPTVRFYGFRQIEENPLFYALASAFVLPSSLEEWGLVVNEAMACSVPVVVSNRVGCAEDLVSHGETGYLFDPDSPDQLANALEKVSQPGAHESLGTRALIRVQEWGCERFASGALEAATTAHGGAGA